MIVTSKRNYSTVTYDDANATVGAEGGFTTVTADSATSSVVIKVKLSDGCTQEHTITQGEVFKYNSATGEIEVRENSS